MRLSSDELPDPPERDVSRIDAIVNSPRMRLVSGAITATSALLPWLVWVVARFMPRSSTVVAPIWAMILAGFGDGLRSSMIGLNLRARRALKNLEVQ